jgi:hypothetical protein
MGRTPTSRGSFSGRRRPLTSLSKRPSTNDSAQKSGKMEEESIIKAQESGMFDSSDEEDGMDNLMMKAGNEKKQQEEIQKQATPKQDEDPLNFEVGDFVAEANDRIENKYFFMKPPLGVGLFGTVYKARHKESGQIRAIKKIRKDHSKAKDIETLLKDVEILKKLDHPNIIKVYEFYQDSGNYYIVTDYCGGGELFDRII